MPKKEQELDEFLDRVFGGKPENKMLEVALERLHPPGDFEVPPKREFQIEAELNIVSETRVVPSVEKVEQESNEWDSATTPNLSGDDSTLARGRYKLTWEDCPKEYQEWCLASETYRFYIFTNEGKTSRKTGTEAMSKIVDIQIERKMVKEIKKIDPNLRNFSNVMNEFKAQVKRIRGD